MPSPAGVIPTLVNMQGMVTGTTCFVNVDNFDPTTVLRSIVAIRCHKPHTEPYTPPHNLRIQTWGVE